MVITVDRYYNNASHAVKTTSYPKVQILSLRINQILSDDIQTLSDSSTS